jgi:hypothetical protein
LEEAVVYSIPMLPADPDRGRLVRQTCTVWAYTTEIFLSEGDCVSSHGRSGGPLLSPEGYVIRGFITSGSFTGRKMHFSRLTPNIVDVVENRIKKGQDRADLIQPLIKIRIDGSGRVKLAR